MIGGEYLVVRNAPSNPDTLLSGDLLSIFGELKIPFADLEHKLSVIARLDINDPNIHKSRDVTRFSVLGVVWKANERVWWSIDHQECRTETAMQKATNGSYVAIDVDQPPGFVPMAE